MDQRTPGYLGLDELSPVVELASCWHMEDNPWYRYRIPGHHLLLLEKGRIEFIAPLGSGSAKAGDLICFRPAEINQYGTFGPTTFYQSHINFAPPPKERLTPWLDEAGPLPLCIPLGGAFKAVRECFEALCLELPQPGAAPKLRVRAAVHELLALIAGACGEHSRKDGAKRDAKAPKLDPWQRARLRLASDLSAPLQVQRLAKELGLSADHFIRQFKARFGLSPKQYRLHAKLKEAARLLRAGEHAVKGVAFELGFADSKAFTRLFKRRFGFTPAEFRAGGGQVPTDSGDARPATSGTLYPLNRHVIPPEAGADWFTRWVPR